MEHRCCDSRGCGSCAYCYGECQQCAPRYGSVDWPPDKEEMAAKRLVCACEFGAKPLEIIGQRSICAECKGYCHRVCACEPEPALLPGSTQRINPIKDLLTRFSKDIRNGKKLGQLFYADCETCGGVKYIQ